MGGSGATGAGSGAASSCRRRSCASSFSWRFDGKSSPPLRLLLMPARLTTRCRGDGDGLPASVAAKSFDGKLPTPSLLSGRFSDGRAGSSRISASSFIVACAVQGWQAGFCWYCTARGRTCHSASHSVAAMPEDPRRQQYARNPAVQATLLDETASVAVTY